MGMFDSVYFRCPHCESEVEVQSKSGPCELNSYTSNYVPLAIAEDLEGRTERCRECRKQFVIRSPGLPTAVPMVAFAKDPLRRNHIDDDEQG